MERLEVVVRKKDGVILPSYATESSSGLDLVAFLEEPVVLAPFARALIPTGIHIGIPEGFEAEIRPRSGMAHKFGVTVLNTPGTIDSDYRGEVKVLLVNLGDQPFTISNGDRIAQMIISRHERVEWKQVDSLNETSRGAGGFGHTGSQ